MNQHVQGIFENLKQQMTLIQQRPKNPYDRSLTSNTLYNIKDTLYNEGYDEAFLGELDERECSRYWRRFQVYNELTDFYDEKLKTSILKRYNSKISEEVFDNHSKLNNLLLQGYTLTPTDCRNIDEQLRVYGKIGILITPNGLDIVEPYRYTLKDNKLKVVVFKDSSNSFENYQYINRYIDDGLLYSDLYVKTTVGYTKDKKGSHQITNTNDLGFFELTTDRFMEDSLFEWQLFHSEVYTALQKEVFTTTPQLFLDEGYIEGKRFENNLAAFTPVKKQSAIPGETPKPLFEIFNPELRDVSYENIISMIEDKVANALGVDRAMVTGNATEGTFQNDKSAKTINAYKREIADNINELLTNFGQGKVQLVPYSLQSKEAIIKNGVLLVNNGIGNNLLVLQELYPNLSKQDLYKLYLTTEIKSQRPLTLKEEEDAISMGLMEEAPEPTPEELSEDITTTKHIDNSDKVNVQGVATGENVNG